MELMITVCILTKNCEETLAKTLDSVKEFPEVLIYDNGSTDRTLSIARSYPNVKIHEAPFSGFGPMRNQASQLSSNDWILALDSDEILSPPLLQKLAQLKLDPSCVYRFPRQNFYNGKRIKGCGWDPEFVIRLYHRKKTRFSDADVHESLLTREMTIVPLNEPLYHTPYRSTADFLSKMQHYSTLFAKQYQHKRSSSFTKAVGHGLFAFFKSYFLKRGCLCGKEGFIISLYNANTAFYKYLKLAEANQADTTASFSRRLRNKM